MPELVTTAVAVLALLTVWRFGLRRTLQDTYQDMLHDVRERVRTEFHIEGKLNSPDYRRLQDSIDRNIRFVKDASFTNTIVFSRWLSKRPELEHRWAEELKEYYTVEDESMKDCVDRARGESRLIIQNAVFHSSFYSIAAIYLLALPCAVAYSLVNMLRYHVSKNCSAFVAEVKTLILHKEAKAIRPEHTEMLSQEMCSA